jgi:hypothetical protein
VETNPTQNTIPSTLLSIWFASARPDPKHQPEPNGPPPVVRPEEAESEGENLDPNGTGPSPLARQELASDLIVRELRSAFAGLTRTR